MQSDASDEARLRAYRLMEAAQGDDHAGARGPLAALEEDAARHGWSDVALLARLGQVLHDVVRNTDTGQADLALSDVVHRAHAQGHPALHAVALGLRAIDAAGRQDSAAVLADAGRAVALAEDPAGPALDRCFAWVVCAAAFNTLSLWELSDELYDRASALAPQCPQPVQEAAVAVNRLLVRLEWAAALFELGEDDAALAQVRRAGHAADLAAGTDGLPELWQLDVATCRELLLLVEDAHRGDPVDARLDRLRDLRTQLVAGDDVEVLPLLDAFTALSLLRLGRAQEARAHVARSHEASSSTGARSFPAWVWAQVAGDGAGESEALVAGREYAALVTRLRWSARTGVLAAARSTIADERLAAEHAALSRAVLQDPLTGLANRRSFDAWLATASAPGEDGEDTATALLLIDLDAFKAVNDLHGHAVGDEVLRRVATVLAHHVRPGDLALRLGGDEFAVVLAGGGDADAMRRTAEERAAAVTAAVAAEDWSQLSPGLRVQVSVGAAAAVVGPHHPDAADAVYRAADADLYDVKARRASR